MNIEWRKFHGWYKLIIKKIRSTQYQAVQYIPIRRRVILKKKKVENLYSNKYLVINDE